MERMKFWVFLCHVLAAWTCIGLFSFSRTIGDVLKIIARRKACSGAKPPARSRPVWGTQGRASAPAVTGRTRAAL
jgi:hypothetical protein